MLNTSTINWHLFYINTMFININSVCHKIKLGLLKVLFKNHHHRNIVNQIINRDLFRFLTD